MILSKRLEEIASLVETEKVIDVGCDHALLSIYLTKEKEKECIAVDISPNVILRAKKNIERYQLQDKIQILVNDGIKNIPLTGDETIIIAGMGSTTILKIIEEVKENPLIVCSNNDQEFLRRGLVKKGYFIEEEKVVFSKNRYYILIRAKKGKKVYKEMEYILGPILLRKKEPHYFRYLYAYYKNVYVKIPLQEKRRRKKIEKIIITIKNLLK